MMSAPQISPRIASLWRQRVDALREYHVVRDGNVFGSDSFGSSVFSSEYDQARHLLEDLMSRYDGVPVEQVFTGDEISRGGISCFRLQTRHPLDPPAVSRDRYLQELFQDLMLIRGIGPVLQKKLNARGFLKIGDLQGHPKFRNGASRVLGYLGQGNPKEIMELVGSRHARSHPSVLGAASLLAQEDYIFFDIETLGLFSRPILLFGIGVMERGCLTVTQYLVRDIAEEEAALAATAEIFSGNRKAVITFNGKSFDIPYLSDRLAYYGMEPLPALPHFDVLHFSRRQWKEQFASLRLSSLEKEILGVVRKDDVPGQMVPEFFETYLRTGNCGPLVPVVEHNRQDVVSLARLFYHLLGGAYGNC